jgi:hypothetical protein
MRLDFLGFGAVGWGVVGFFAIAVLLEMGVFEARVVKYMLLDIILYDHLKEVKPLAVFEHLGRSPPPQNKMKRICPEFVGLGSIRGQRPRAGPQRRTSEAKCNK